MLTNYAKQEARAAIRLHHLVVLAVSLIGAVVTSFLLPSMPESIYRFFKKVFVLSNWTEVILLNDFLGLFAALFWVGVIDLLRVYVLPKEEGYLELLFSKPLGRTEYLFAKVLPAFGVVAGLGIIMSLFLPLKIALINGAADLHLVGMVCAGVVTTTLVLALLALLNLVFLFARETYYAVLLAFAVFALVVLPIGLFMYRPDVFQDQPVLRNLVVFPVNLLWINEWLPNIAPVIAFVAATLSLLLLAWGGWRLRSIDIQ
jgi:ABC-type transport system involved in multi-copper enzyme maturation permease subunit